MPFTRDEFFHVFAAYNDDVWPLQLVLFAAALLAIAAAATKRHRIASFVLAALFAWCGVAYHWSHFTTINPAAWLFGALFLFGAVAFTATRVEFMSAGRAGVSAGVACAAYSLLVYPAIGYALGHRYPSTPTFGAPCPVTTFALGLLLTARRPLPATVLVAPLLWTAIGSTAAFQFGMLEDLGMLAAGLTLLTLGILRRTLRLQNRLSDLPERPPNLLRQHGKEIQR